MNIDTLFMFSHIVETGSMTRAAQHLHISQSALTQQVKTLENQLSARLLERSNRGVVPTAAGEVVYRAALDIHELRRKMEQELESLRTDARILRIAATHLVYTYALPCTLFDLKRKFSGIRLETEALSSGQIEDKVTAGKVDIGIIVGAPHDPGLHQTLVFTDRVCLVAGDRFPCPSVLSAAALYRQPLLMLAAGHRSRTLLDDRLRGMGLELDRLDVAHTFDSIETIRQSAINGFGLAFLPYSTVKKELFSRQLRIIELEGFSLEHEYHMITRAAGNPELARLLAYLEQTLSETIC